MEFNRFAKSLYRSRHYRANFLGRESVNDLFARGLTWIQGLRNADKNESRASQSFMLCNGALICSNVRRKEKLIMSADMFNPQNSVNLIQTQSEFPDQSGSFEDLSELVEMARLLRTF